MPFRDQKREEDFHQTSARFEQKQHERWRQRWHRQKNVSDVGTLVTSERIAEPRLISMEDSRNLHPKEVVLEVSKKKKPETSQNVP